MTDFTRGWGISNLLCNGRRRVKSDHYRPLQRGNGSHKTSNWALRNSWTFPCVAQSDCSILWYTKSLKGINWYFRFNVRSYTLMKVACASTTFVWVRPDVFLVQSDSSILWSSISPGKNHLIAMSDHCHFVFFSHLFSCIFYQFY